MQIFSDFNRWLREIKNRDCVRKRKDEKMMEMVIPAANKTLKRKRKNQEDEKKIEETKIGRWLRYCLKSLLEYKERSKENNNGRRRGEDTEG